MSGYSQRIEVRAMREPWLNDTITLRLIHVETRDGVRIGAAARAPEFVKVNDGDFVEPFLHLSPGEAQALMDELWRVGVRPTEGHGSVGQLAATERHLEDMRRLVFEDRKGAAT